MIKFFKYLNIFGCTLCLLFGCIKSDHLPGQSSPPLTLAMAPFTGYYPAIIAQEKGFFKDQGVEVKLNFESSIQTSIANFSAGKYDGIGLTLGSVINLSANDPDFQTVMAVSETVGADVVVAQPAIRTIDDLKGKTVGVVLGAGSEIFIVEMLKVADLTRDDVTIIKVEPSMIAETLTNNIIQAGHTWEPYLSDALRSGGHILFTSKETPGLIIDVLAFRDDVTGNHPDQIRALIRGWNQGLAYWEAHEEEADRIISKVLNISPDSISLEGINMLDLEENKTFFNVESPTSLYKTAKIYQDFFIEAGNVTRFPDLKTLFNDAFIRP